MLTIKSGKKGPQIKKGMIDEIIKFIKTVFEYFKLFIKNFKIKNCNKLFSLEPDNFFFLIFSYEGFFDIIF